RNSANCTRNLFDLIHPTNLYQTRADSRATFHRHPPVSPYGLSYYTPSYYPPPMQSYYAPFYYPPSPPPMMLRPPLIGPYNPRPLVRYRREEAPSSGQQEQPFMSSMLY
ncbi:hypothetical protein MTO96_037556, partial [Rhipicephalus appendiculatus]